MYLLSIIKGGCVILTNYVDYIAKFHSGKDWLGCHRLACIFLARSVSQFLCHSFLNQSTSDLLCEFQVFYGRYRRKAHHFWWRDLVVRFEFESSQKKFRTVLFRWVETRKMFKIELYWLFSSRIPFPRSIFQRKTIFERLKHLRENICWKRPELRHTIHGSCTTIMHLLNKIIHRVSWEPFQNRPTKNVMKIGKKRWHMSHMICVSPPMMIILKGIK